MGDSVVVLVAPAAAGGSPEERLFVDTLIRNDWLLRRYARADAEIWEHAMSDSYIDQDAPLGHAFIRFDKNFERLQRRINATERSYRHALHELERLQASRPDEPAVQPVPAPPSQPVETEPASPQIGFVSHIPAQDPKPRAVSLNPLPCTPLPANLTP